MRSEIGMFCARQGGRGCHGKACYLVLRCDPGARGRVLIVLVWRCGLACHVCSSLVKGLKVKVEAPVMPGQLASSGLTISPEFKHDLVMFTAKAETKKVCVAC